MFGINFKTLRWALSWNFAFLCLLCTVLACWLIVRTSQLQVNAASSHPRALLVDAVFPAMATVFGFAWWKMWKQRPSARAWGIAASVLITAHPVWRIIRFPRSIHGYNVLVLAVGVVGLLAFLMPDEATPKQNAEELEEPSIEGI